MPTSDPRIAIDSNFFVALFNPHDTLHEKALHLASQLETEPERPLIISNLVFVEVVTVLAQRRGTAVRNEVGEYLRKDPRIVLIHIDPDMHQASWELFRSLPHKNVSFVDCSTLVLMREEGIRTLLSFDRTDFTKLRKHHRFSWYE